MAGLEFCDRTREGGKEKGREKIELLACDLRPIITRHVLPACVFLFFFLSSFFFSFLFFRFSSFVAFGDDRDGLGVG